jgi:hypothetical protein
VKSTSQPREGLFVLCFAMQTSPLDWLAYVLPQGDLWD